MWEQENPMVYTAQPSIGYGYICLKEMNLSLNNTNYNSCF